MSDPRPIDSQHLRSVAAFCRAAKLGSFSLAARTLSMTPGAVSRSVARLERRLGRPLLRRSTQGLQLTAAGDAYLRLCAPAIEALQRATQAARAEQRAPEGALRVSCSALHAHFRVLSMLAAFRSQHPFIDVELDVSDRLADFSGAGVDIALRTGEPQGDLLVYRTIEHCTLGVFASPQYLARCGEPRSLADLGRHRCITYLNPADGKVLDWRLREPSGRPIDLAVPSAMQVRGDGVACLQAAVAGAGLCQSYHFAAEPHLRRGELVEVLRPSSGRTVRWSVVHPGGRHVNSRARAFIDFLVRRTAPQAGRHALPQSDRSSVPVA